MSIGQLFDSQKSFQTRQLSAEDYARMIESGILAEDERLELIQGEIVLLPPIGDRHVRSVNLLNYLFGPLMAERKIWISIQNPIHLNEYSVPQPDLAIIKFRPDLYLGRKITPEDILLLIEVMDTTDHYDRTIKLLLYAQAGILETWLVDLNHSSIEVYLGPEESGYREKRTYREADRFSPQALPAITLAVADLF
jgi:Uma2 family endonuclease